MSSKSESNVSVKKLHVRGIKEHHTEEDLKEYFTSFGTVEQVQIVRDKNTGALKGFAFITFDDYDPVDKCLCKYEMMRTCTL